MNKIIQILIAPENSKWQGVLIGLSDDGVVYECSGKGRWEKFIPPINTKGEGDESRNNM